MGSKVEQSNNHDEGTDELMRAVREMEQRIERRETAMERLQREKIERLNKEALRIEREKAHDRNIVKFMAVGFAFIAVVFGFCYMLIL